jgi:hypothetical protein
MSRRSADEVVVIMWRDIPAQVNGRSSDAKHGVVLPRRFQRAIDRAAMVAGKKTAQEYVAEWRRESHPLAGDLVECVTSMASAIEAELTPARLKSLVENGGWNPTSTTPEELPS